MKLPMAVVVQLLILFIVGLIVALIANHRGRDPYGWFLFGVFFSFLALVLVVVLPDLKKQQEREQRLMDENRRLREQLRKDRMMADSRHLEVRRRLEAHDSALAMDTGTAASAALPHRASEESPGPEIPDPRSTQWWYVQEEMRKGPFGFERLRTLWEEGEIGLPTRVWTKGMPDWARIEALPHLLEAFDV